MDLDRLGVRGGCHLHFSNVLKILPEFIPENPGESSPKNLPDDGEKVDVSCFFSAKKKSHVMPNQKPLQCKPTVWEVWKIVITVYSSP